MVDRVLPILTQLARFRRISSEWATLRPWTAHGSNAIRAWWAEGQDIHQVASHKPHMVNYLMVRWSHRRASVGHSSPSHHRVRTDSTIRSPSNLCTRACKLAKESKEEVLQRAAEFTSRSFTITDQATYSFLVVQTCQSEHTREPDVSLTTAV